MLPNVSCFSMFYVTALEKSGCYYPLNWNYIACVKLITISQSCYYLSSLAQWSEGGRGIYLHADGGRASAEGCGLDFERHSDRAEFVPNLTRLAVSMTLMSFAVHTRVVGRVCEWVGFQHFSSILRQNVCTLYGKTEVYFIWCEWGMPSCWGLKLPWTKTLYSTGHYYLLLLLQDCSWQLLMDQNGQSLREWFTVWKTASLHQKRVHCVQNSVLLFLDKRHDATTRERICSRRLQLFFA